MSNMNHFIGLYPISKTLRFELKPIGNTKVNIEKNGIIERDSQRAVGYKVVKKVMDEYHKAFIERMLNDFENKLDEEDRIDWRCSLWEFYSLYLSPSSDNGRNEKLIKVQERLRKQIANVFKKDRRYNRLFADELIHDDLTEFVHAPIFENYIRSQKGNEDISDPEVKTIQETIVQDITCFRDFTTYFDGYNTSRKNMYVADGKATSIAHRMIDENLPKFIDNVEVFKKIADCDEIRIHFATLYKAMEQYLNVLTIDEMFQLEYFPMVLTQKQIDVYNAVIGGRTEADGMKIQGLNEYINLYNQQQKDKSKRLPKLKPLFKQILSERNSISWLSDEFESDNEMLESVECCYQDLKSKVFDGGHSLKSLLSSIRDYDLNHIYLRNDSSLSLISQKQYGGRGVIGNAIFENAKASNPQKRNESNEKYEERISKIQKGIDSYSIGYLNDVLRNKLDDFKPIEDYFLKMGAVDDEAEQKPNLFTRIENAYTEAHTLLTSPYPEGRQLSQDKKNVEKIKNLLDAIKELQHFVKPLLDQGTESEKDNNFYGEFIPFWELLDQITVLYNMVRNRMTQNPYNDEKIKLYFDNNATFLRGWVDSKTESSDNGTQYGGYLFRRQNAIGEYDYYLGVSKDIKLFRRFKEVEESDKSTYERLDYYQLKSKTFYGTLYKGDYEIETSNIKRAIDNVVNSIGSASIKEKLYNEKSKRQPKTATAIGYLKFIKQQDEELYSILLKDKLFEESNKAIIASMKSTLLSLNRIPSACEYAQRNYVLFSVMMDDIDNLLQEKIFSYFPVSQCELDEVVDRNLRPLYLFKISNKDLSFAETYTNGLRKNRGTENLHTMYFKALMSGTQNVFDIGSGAIYFREHKISYTEEQLKRGHHYEMLKDRFSYPIISNKRYAFDKFQFHLSVNLNYNANKNVDLNTLVNSYLKESNSTHIIGIDRGERNLLYLSLIDLHGNIVDQYSLNEIGDEYNRTNYHELLDKKENQRKEARPSWQTIESIKELKEGYMSQVIHKIVELMVKYNAIVVLEDLNKGFKRGRQKVEKQVYQKFEKMLIDKLNYLVDKKLAITEPGGVLKAYQLTNKFESFQKMGKQNGFLFYVPAWNTSKMDPTTGFVNLFDTRYENMAKAKAFFGKFESIRYNSEGWFEFAFDYTDFTTKASGTRTKWVICTHGTRIETRRDPNQNNQFVSEEFDLTSRFIELFSQYKIDPEGNLMEQICSQIEATFYKEMLHLLHLTLQMRNSKTGTDIDYLISPVINSRGKFYDSRHCGKNLPNNADANGAYNIARKGLWIIEHIKQSDDLTHLRFAISNKEWLQYTQRE